MQICSVEGDHNKNVIEMLAKKTPEELENAALILYINYQKLKNKSIAKAHHL